MTKRSIHLITSPGFLAGLSLLLLNDFALKPLFHNWLTGKLSDFTGLFVFPLFCAALLPRFRRAIYFLTAVSFLFWKSPYSQPLIDYWNGVAALTLGRTVDASDLLALLALPLSYSYYERGRRQTPRRLAPYLIAAVSVFAFTATSFRTKVPYDSKYHFADSPVELTRKVYHLGHLDSKYRVAPCSQSGISLNNIDVNIPADFCFDEVEAVIGIGEEQGQSVITLKKMEHRCPEGRSDKEKLRAVFEKQFVEKLKGVSLAPPAQPVVAEPSPSATPRLRAGGQLYFVSVGDVPGVSVEALAGHYRRKYGVPITVLPKLPITDEMRQPDFPHGRLSAGGMMVALARQYPQLFKDTRSVVVGITEGMTLEQAGNRLYHISLDLEGRFAVVAAEALRPTTFCEPENKELLETRLRKAVAKAIGTLYFRLPKSDDPKSVLYSNVGCVDELDYQGEDFTG